MLLQNLQLVVGDTTESEQAHEQAILGGDG
jgi:hypothetical protein